VPECPKHLNAGLNFSRSALEIGDPNMKPRPPFIDRDFGLFSWSLVQCIKLYRMMEVVDKNGGNVDGSIYAKSR